MVTRKSSRPGGLRILVGGYPVPGSSALYVPLTDDYDDYTGAIIRCGKCYRRLFDVRVGREYIGDAFDHSPVHATRVFAERKCPNCGVKCERSLTVTDGEAVGDDGAWSCPRCAEHGRGGYLARIVAPKGRIIVDCPKCKADTRLNTPVIYRELKRLTELEHGGPLDDFHPLFR